VASDSTFEREIERCHSEIADAERSLRSGHPDVAGLCLALSDWSAELRILEEERRRVLDPAVASWVWTLID
jgi:hypothetical protein